MRFFLIVCIFAFCAHSVQAWEARRSGDQGILFLGNDKEFESFTFYDKQGKMTATLWDFKKEKIDSYSKPVLIAQFTFGTKHHSLKVIDPSLSKDKRVLFSFQSLSGKPNYKVVKKGQKSVIEFTGFENQKLPQDKTTKLHQHLPNPKPYTRHWPKP